MTYATNSILRDADNVPIPQLYDPAGDTFDVWQGTDQDGARVILYDGSGNVLLVATPGKVQGAAAHDAAASGNPVQVGGVYRVADPAVADGDAASLRVSAKGEALVEVAQELPAGTQIIGSVKVSDGTDMLLIDANGALMAVPYDSAGAELFTAANPGGVEGAAADNAAASGNPVQAGGKYSMADPALDDGDIGYIRVNAKGEAITQLTGSSAGDAITPSDGDIAQLLHAYNAGDDEWERWRNNDEGVLLASAVRATSTPSATMTNYNHRGVALFLGITAVPGSDSITVNVQVRDAATAGWRTIATGAAHSTMGVERLIVYPGVSSGGSFDVARDVPLPRTWRAYVAHSGAGSFTYSLSYALLL